MPKVEEDHEKALRLPLEPEDFETVKEWKNALGLTNRGVGRRLAQAVEEGRL